MSNSTKKLRYFKLVHGRHAEKDPNHTGRDFKLIQYTKGEVVATKTDLNRLNSSGSIKFVEIDKPRNFKPKWEVAATTPVEVEEPSQDPTDNEEESEVEDEQAAADRATYEAMTVDELKSFAEEEEINLHGATRKANIIDEILKATTG